MKKEVKEDVRGEWREDESGGGRFRKATCCSILQEGGWA